MKDNILNKLSIIYREYADFTPEGMEKAYKVSKVIHYYLRIRYKLICR